MPELRIFELCGDRSDIEIKAISDFKCIEIFLKREVFCQPEINSACDDVMS